MGKYLIHYGILGMKWGVRRDNPSSGSSSRTKKQKKVTLKQKAKTMSDDELKKAVNRLQMEKQYSQLSSEDVSRGKAFAQKLMKAGTTIAAVTTTGLTIYNNAEKIKSILKRSK